MTTRKAPGAREVPDSAPDGAAPPPAGPEALEERVRAWTREEALAWMKEMEKALHERFQTLAATDIRIIRELRKLQGVAPARGREPM